MKTAPNYIRKRTAFRKTQWEKQGL